MPKQSRREFVGLAGKMMAATGITTITPNMITDMPQKEMFIHHVYFWLKNEGNEEDKKKLVEGLRTLTKVKNIQMYQIGQPADTNREVIDRSYAISWMLVFKNKADQDSYQTDPIHLDFVKNYSHLWSKVIVYDSVNV
jgi:hypothetical protein